MHEGCQYARIPASNPSYWRPKLLGNAERDKYNIKKLEEMGYTVFTVWECELKKTREERLEKLLARMDELGLKRGDYAWYIDTRRFGTTIHSGYGVGFERLVMYLTGVANIRDVEIFPRTVGSIIG